MPATAERLARMQAAVTYAKALEDAFKDQVAASEEALEKRFRESA